jgi:hypothetical protein
MHKQGLRPKGSTMEDDKEVTRGQDAAGPSRTAQSIRKIFRNAEPHFGQGLRKTFVNLGFKLERQRQYKAPKQNTLDKVAMSHRTRNIILISVTGVLLLAIAWGGIKVYQTTTGSQITAFEEPFPKDVLKLKVRSFIETLMRDNDYDPSKLESTQTKLDKISLEDCKTFLPATRDALFDDLEVAYSPIDKTSVESRLPLRTGMYLRFSFKIDACGNLTFIRFRHELR